MYRIHVRDKRRWFQVHCCKEVVKVEAASPFNVTVAIGFALTAVMAVMVIGLMIHYMGGTASAGVLIANAPLALPEIQTKLEAIFAEVKEHKTSKEKIETALRQTQTELKTAIDGKADLQIVQAIQRQLDAIDMGLAERHVAGGRGETLEQSLKEDGRL